MTARVADNDLIWPSPAPIECRVHGFMQWRGCELRWTCAGFDGEGCPAVVTTAEAQMIVDGRPIDLEGSAIKAWFTEHFFGEMTRIQVDPGPAE